MKKRAALAGLFAACALAGAETVDIRDGWFRVDGEPVFLKGVCYFDNHLVDGAFKHVALEEMDYEFARIREAGFNALRAHLTAEELDVARKHGLLVLQSGSLYFESDFENPAFVAGERSKLLDIVHVSRDFDNVLGYYLGNEPNAQVGPKLATEESFNAFYRDRAAAVKRIAPGAPVSLANFPAAAFLDHAPFDFAALNLYPGPPSQPALGYTDYADWYRRRHATGKPFVISEYGWTRFNGIERMAEGLVDLLDQQLAAGAAGSFLFTWRAFGAETTNDYENQWRGIVPTQGRNGDYTNAPRPAFSALQKYFEAVVVEPRPGQPCDGQATVRVYGTERTRSVTVEAGGKKTRLKRSGKLWWTGEVKLPAGVDTLRIAARDRSGDTLVDKTCTVQNRARREVRLTIQLAQSAPRAGETIHATITAEDDAGIKMPGLALRIAVHQTGRDLFSSQPLTGTTDADGVCAVVWPNAARGYFTLFAGTDAPPEFTGILGDARTVRVE